MSEKLPPDGAVAEVTALDEAAAQCRAAERLFYEDRRDEALHQARHAVALAGGAREIAHFCAWLFSNCGAHREAADCYRQLIQLAPEVGEWHRHLSGSLAASGDLDRAIEHALIGQALAPEISDFAVHAAELLLRRGAAEAAITLLRDAAQREPGDGRVWRVLSGAEMVCERMAAALAAIDQALMASPDDPEYHLHRGHLLHRAGDIEAADAAFTAAARLRPDDPAPRRARLALLLDSGRIAEATTLGGDLLSTHPEDVATAEAVRHLLNRRLDPLEGEFVVLSERALSLPRPPRRPPGFCEQCCSQVRVIYALVLRETRTRFGDSKLGYGWALLEPILHIALLSVVFSLLMRGQPPIGGDFFSFYYTGLIPYHVFVHTSSSMMHAITANRALLQLPTVTTFDAIAARGILETVTDIVVATLLLIGFGIVGLQVIPDDLLPVMLAFLTTAALGCGFGFVNAVLAATGTCWDKIWPQVTRALYFFSGIFYVPGMMPDWARDILLWNPLLHAIDWFRAGFYASYQPHWLDPSYLALTALAALLGGIALERALRSRLHQPP